MATNPEISMDDAEIAALLEELEEEQTKMTAAPEPEPEPEPEPVAVKQPEPEPKPEPVVVVDDKFEPAPEPEPVAVKQPEPEPEIEVAPRGRMTKIPQEPEPVAEKPATKLNFYVDVNEFNRDTKLTEATLDTAMMEQAALRAFYGTQAAQAEAQHARLKVRFDVLEAKLYDEHRKELAASGEKVTEKMVENAVKLDPRWIQGKNTVIEAETIASVNKSLVISLADRRDMMIQLGADRREEFKGGVRILADQNERETLAARAAQAFKNAHGNVQ